MEKFETFSGLLAPLDAQHADTDQIIPKQFLKRVERTGYGEFLFFDWRFNDDGSLNQDFEMNHDRYQGASILIARDNFGPGDHYCGVWHMLPLLEGGDDGWQPKLTYA